MYGNNDWRDYELAHHGILGMKWGKKNGPPYPLDSSDHSSSEKKAGWKKSLGATANGKNEKLYSDGPKKEKEAFSVKAAGHKALAKVYEINEKTYSKSNKTLSSMNKAAKTEQLKKAEQAQKEANLKKQEKKELKKAEQAQKKELKEAYKQIDPNVAKNKVTKRAALDYHNMNDLQFMAKYKTSKKTFAKRYEKTKGDTYSLGKKKAAVALTILSVMPPTYIYGKNGTKLQVAGKKAALKSAAYDFGSVAIGTNLGYQKAEKKYYENK